MHPARTAFLVPAALATLVLLAWLAPRPDAKPDGSTVHPAPASRIRAEPDPVRSPASFRHELESWVVRAPDEACAWVLGLPAEDRLAAATALLIAAADHPGLATRLAQRLSQADPVFIREHGAILLAVLMESGASNVALQFAAQGGPESSTWLDSTFRLWAARDPAQAAHAALTRPDGEGFSTVASVWAGQDPAGLAGFAMAELQGASRALAMDEALRQWLARDPVAVAAWLDRFAPAAELDAGVSALARLPALARPHPDIALGWAASIVDPELRARTLAGIATQWAGVNPFAARQYVSITGELTPTDRLDLLAVLDRPPD